MYPEISYIKANVCFFSKVKDQWGELSNMSNAYGVNINGQRIKNTEALYQACRFPDNPEAQVQILAGHSGMSSKMTSKKYRVAHTRIDWRDIRIDVMKYCLALKLYQNPPLRKILLATENAPIVELSHKDKFWGTVEKEKGVLVGQNVLGQLWCEIRDNIINGVCDYKSRPTSEIENFMLIGQQIK